MLRLVKTSDQRRYDVAVLWMIIVSRAVHVSRHDRNVIGTILITVGLAEFDSGDLGDGVPFISGLKRVQ